MGISLAEACHVQCVDADMLYVDPASFTINSNILVKTVTAPFRFLANLVGSNEDLQSLAFVAGSDTFDGDTRAKLDTLVDALEQRPALGVLVRGSIDPHADLHKLREQALQQQLLADGLAADDLAARNAEWEAALVTRYSAMDSLPSDSETTDVAPVAEEIPVETLREAILATIQIPRETLDALVGARAAAVKRYLVNEGGIAADRLSVSGRAEESALAGAVLDVST